MCACVCVCVYVCVCVCVYVRVCVCVCNSYLSKATLQVKVAAEGSGDGWEGYHRYTVKLL